MSLRRLILGGAVALLLASLPAAAAAAAAARAGHTYYVKAGAAAGGTGSRSRPFASLSAVERAAGPGARIVVLPSPAGRPPLGGGIVLKRNQKLVGAGSPVTRLTASSPAPRVTNASGAHHSGDAITLADGAEVSNLVVAGAYRGGIYGRNVSGVLVRGSDLSATNTSCTTGFVVQPFTLPTFAPGVGAPFSSGLSNGWAAIMLDETHGRANLSIAGNRVHDAGCSDGIDVRASGTAHVAARVDHNTLTHLRQDPSKQSELAIGMQSTGTAHLTARVDRNHESYIGTATVGDFGDSDSEGLFGNGAGRSYLTEHADHNTFAHGLGHISANCVEFVSSNGGPTMHMTLSHSTCRYVVGDVLEAANLSRDATLTFRADHVLAAHSTFAGSQAWTAVEPGDDGDCMLEVASGAASTTNVHIANSTFTHCVADGLGVVSNVVDGKGPQKKLSFEVENSAITQNKLSNLRVGNVTPVRELDGRVEHTDLSRSPGTLVVLEGLDTSNGTRARLDLGGGSLGSQGHNCLFGGGQTDVTAARDDLSARHDWWGDPSGPPTGSVVAAQGTVAYRPPLPRASCGPGSPRHTP